MLDDKRRLKGSPSRDLFKQQHKIKAPKNFYAFDLDLCLVCKHPYGIVAFIDFKKWGDKVSFSEVIGYNFLFKLAPIYIIKSNDPENGPFYIYIYDGGDPQPEPPIVNLSEIHKNLDWKGLAEWEYELRATVSFDYSAPRTLRSRELFKEVRAPTEATGATAPPEGGSEFERLTINWGQVIAQAPEDAKRTPAIAILRSASVKPLAFEDDTVVLAFRYSYHMEKIKEPENQRITEKIISNFLGHSCHVRCIYQPEDNHLVREAQKIGAQIIDTEEK